MVNDYPQLRRIGKLIYESWNNRPDPPTWAKGGLKALGYEVAEEFITLNLEAAKAINEGRARGKDQYGMVERERVESLGTKFIYSPGGFVV
jgi:hypothetical protein